MMPVTHFKKVGTVATVESTKKSLYARVKAEN